MVEARVLSGLDAATAIWDASIAKVNLSDVSGSAELQELSNLIGERDDATDSITYDDRGSRASERSVRRVAVIPPDVIRTLPYGISLMQLHSASPIIMRMREWTARPEAFGVRAGRKPFEQALQGAAATG